MEQEHDLTQGSLVKTVVVFAIPFLLANLIQAFYGAADLMVVGCFYGHTGDADYYQFDYRPDSRKYGSGWKLYRTETAGGGEENHWHQFLSLCRDRSSAFGFAVFALPVDSDSSSDTGGGL